MEGLRHGARCEATVYKEVVRSSELIRSDLADTRPRFTETISTEHGTSFSQVIVVVGHAARQGTCTSRQAS
jgi:hypothetical protein